MRTKYARLNQVERELEQVQEEASINRDAAVLISDLINAGVVKQKTENQFVIQAAQGELNFDYSQQQQL